MKKLVLILVGVVVIIGAGVAVWLIAPLFYDTEVQEALPGSENDSVSVVSTLPRQGSTTQQPVESPVTTSLTTGTFTGFDSSHQAAGTARLLDVNGTNYIRFEDDFTVTNGPDLFVYLGRNGEYDPATNLGRLKGNKGSQNYEIPAGIDLSGYTEVWVWCRAFAVPFGKAVLE